MSSAIPTDLSILVIGVGEKSKGWFVEVVLWLWEIVGRGVCGVGSFMPIRPVAQL